MPKDYTPIEHKICEKSIGLHFGNGKVHDTDGNKNRRSTKWRSICEIMPQGKVGLVEVEINGDEEMIFWKF